MTTETLRKVPTPTVLEYRTRRQADRALAALCAAGYAVSYSGAFPRIVKTAATLEQVAQVVRS